MKARASSSVSNSPLPDENTESPRDSLVSSANSGANSPGADVVAESELLCLTSPVDLLCGPVPSCLPSPQLHPDPVLQQTDLIHFEERPPPTEYNKAEAVAEVISDLPEQPGTVESSEDPKQPPTTKPPLSSDSPNRRASRSRFKLAANFSFPAGL